MNLTMCIAAPRFGRRFLVWCLFQILFVAFAQSPQVGSKSSEADIARSAQLAESFVTEKLAVWQQNLGLEDWKISIVMSRRSDLKARTLGGIRWDKPKKSAEIRVLAASEYRLSHQQMLDDMEFTIVHELIHLHLSSLPRSEASRRDEEHAVNKLAEVLLKLDRRK